MVLDKRAAVRRRFALLLGTTDARRSGLPIAPAVDTGSDFPFERSTVDDADATTSAHSNAARTDDDDSHDGTLQEGGLRAGRLDREYAR